MQSFFDCLTVEDEPIGCDEKAVRNYHSTLQKSQKIAKLNRIVVIVTAAWRVHRFHVEDNIGRY
jgi:hypothetical protein